MIATRKDKTTTTAGYEGACSCAQPKNNERNVIKYGTRCTLYTTLTEWQYVNRNSVSTAIVNKAVVGTFHSIEVGFASACK